MSGEPPIPPVRPPHKRSSSTHSGSSLPNGAAVSRPLRLRIVIAGPESAGKSCIIKRYCEKRFVQRYMPTIGIDYGATKIYIDKREAAIHIFDTSGSPWFKEVRNEFYRDTHGIILAFDVGNRDSFDALCQWTHEIYLELVKSGRDFDKTVVMVCANKCDTSATARQVDEVEAKLWAELRGFTCFETSAQNGHGINDMFHAFFSNIVRIHDEGANGLPKTPSSARKVQLTQSPSNTSINSVSSRSRLSNSHLPKIPVETSSKPQPSPDQRIVMDRLRNGRDPFQQLGLIVGCSKEDVNRVYRKVAVLLHPDKTEVEGADEAFKTLGVARRNILRMMGAL